MLTTIKGIYGHGKITLTEEPPITTTKSEIIITFLPEQQNAFAKSRRILGGLEGKIIVPDDFNEPLDGLKGYM